MEQNTPSGIDWRYTARKVRLGPFDSYVVFPPLIIFALKIGWFTFFIMLGTIAVMWVVEIFLHMPLGTFLRMIRRFVAGSRRSAVPWWRQKRL